MRLDITGLFFHFSSFGVNPDANKRDYCVQFSSFESQISAKIIYTCQNGL